MVLAAIALVPMALELRSIGLGASTVAEAVEGAALAVERPEVPPEPAVLEQVEGFAVAESAVAGTAARVLGLPVASMGLMTRVEKNRR